jgi:hypothetical protein
MPLHPARWVLLAETSVAEATPAAAPTTLEEALAEVVRLRQIIATLVSVLQQHGIDVPDFSLWPHP